MSDAGKSAFEAYNTDRGGVNFKGDKTPEWEELPEEIRHAWGVAAEAVRQQMVSRLESVIFDLARDALPIGTVAKAVEDLEAHPPPYQYAEDHSFHLGAAARHLAERVLVVVPQSVEASATVPKEKVELITSSMGGGAYTPTVHGVSYTDADDACIDITLMPGGFVQVVLDRDTCAMDLPADVARTAFRHLLMCHFPRPDGSM